MSARGIIYDIISGAWAALTADQRSCWHFFAQAHPITDEAGELVTLNGWELYYRQNVYIAVSNTYSLLSDPPANLDPPPSRNMQATLWSVKGLLGTGETIRRPILLLEVKEPLHADVFEILTQEYITNHGGPPTPACYEHTQPTQQPQPRHVLIIPPLFTGLLDLRTPSGYFATTGGRAKFSKIFGVTARRRPDLPAARLIAVSLINGSTSRSTVANAAGYARPSAPIIDPQPVVAINVPGGKYSIRGDLRNFFQPGTGVFAVGGAHPGGRNSVSAVTFTGGNTEITVTTPLVTGDDSTFLRRLRSA